MARIWERVKVKVSGEGWSRVVELVVGAGAGGGVLPIGPIEGVKVGGRGLEVVGSNNGVIMGREGGIGPAVVGACMLKRESIAVCGRVVMVLSFPLPFPLSFSLPGEDIAVRVHLAAGLEVVA
jgi:hypothetical protein